MLARIISVSAAFALACTTAFGATDSVVGKWKFDPNKSHLSGLQYKIEDAGGGKYRFIFGDDVEVLTLDGKDHLTKYGNTWSIKTTGPNRWESTIKRDGKVTDTSTWVISSDGETFTSTDESRRPDGSVGRSQGVLRRTAGKSGLVGSWVSTSVKIMTPWEIELAKWQDGYSLINPAYKERVDFRFDGKNYTPNGPRVPKGTSVAARKMDDYNMELTYRLKGKVTQTERWKLATGGKTLTQTTSYSGVNKPEVSVYNRR